MNVSRRRFIAEFSRDTIGTALIITGYAVAGKKKMQPVVLDLSKREYKPLTIVGGAMKIPNPEDRKRPIIVVRLSDTEAAAFSSRCTHMGCELPLPVNGIITCPCHGAKFDENGNVTHGPAKKNLHHFASALADSTVTITEPS